MRPAHLCYQTSYRTHRGRCALTVLIAFLFDEVIRYVYHDNCGVSKILFNTKTSTVKFAFVNRYGPYPLVAKKVAEVVAKYRQSVFEASISKILRTQVRSRW